MSRPSNKTKFQYQVALSFAGEDRKHASKLVELLQQRNISTYYDEFDKATLWGKNLYDYLTNIYSDQAFFCIMFISKNYAKKAWTNHERKIAQARAFREHREYILPLKLDDTVIPTVPETIGYIDIRNTSLEEVANIVDQKLKDYQTNSSNSDLKAEEIKASKESSSFGAKISQLKMAGFLITVSLVVFSLVVYFVKFYSPSNDTFNRSLLDTTHFLTTNGKQLDSLNHENATSQLPPSQDNNSQSQKRELTQYLVKLLIPSHMSNAKILVDGKDAKIMERTLTIITILVEKKDTRHRLTLKKGNLTCTTELLIIKNESTVQPCI